MLKGRFDLPKENGDALDECREIGDRLIHDYLRITLAAKCDPASVTRALHLAQQLKNVMCDSFILPFGPSTYPITGESEVAKKKRIREAVAAEVAEPSPV